MTPQDLATARATWPDIAADDAGFTAYATERDGADAPHLADLYLAWGCATGDAAAIAAFERHFVGDIGAALAKMRLAPALADEIRQRVREKVLVAKDGAPPKIADYSGRGPLKGWLRAVATRTALDAVRREARQPTSDETLLDRIPAAFDDPMAGELRRRYAPQFAEAFRDAFAELATAERLLLKRHFADGLTTGQIGIVEGVHRVTVLRQLDRALAKLGARVEALLRARLALPESEVAELVQALRSQLELSLSALRSSQS